MRVDSFSRSFVSGNGVGGVLPFTAREPLSVGPIGIIWEAYVEDYL